MRTQVINDPASVIPRLQRVAEDGETEQILLESFPFTVGRNNDCDLQIESPKVSREHAAISRNGQGFCVDDLGSTNGTSVNGRRIEHAELNDGDILVIADLEFTFDLPKEPKRRETVTLAIGEVSGGDADSDPGPHRLIREVRRMHEILTHGGVRCQIRPIMNLHDDRLFGFQAGDPFEGEGTASGRGARAILATDCRLAEQLCYLNRLIVAEEALRHPDYTNLFLRLHQSEIGGDRLSESLESLSEMLAGRHQLVVTVPAASVGLTSYFSEIRRRLSELGALVAYDGFEASPAQLTQWSHEPPDFVKLAPSLSAGIGGDRHRRRLFTSLLDTAIDLRIRIVATGLQDFRDVHVCQELGCPLGEGPVFGGQPVAAAFQQSGAGSRDLQLVGTG